MNQIAFIYWKCKKSGSSFIILAVRFLYYRIIHHKTLLLHQHVTIKGIKNIKVKKRLEVGIAYVGFSHKNDRTLLNIQGKLIFRENYLIGRGCRFDVGKKGIIEFGIGGYINNDSTFIIMNKLLVGDNCAISWNCQFLDCDFHEFSYPGKKESDPSIIIGDHVWIGCGSKIYKGSVIPDGCIVASDSVVKGVFTTKNALIGGNPARVLKENVEWV